MELPHGLLKVGVELGHAAREEGVYHALREVATQVCLEERDQLGLVGLPEKATAAVRFDMYHRGFEAQSHSQQKWLRHGDHLHTCSSLSAQGSSPPPCSNMSFRGHTARPTENTLGSWCHVLGGTRADVPCGYY